uniref:UPF0235 protein BECKDK2373C_GA0170839_101527 n=1 Tax=Candidatus Kentrum sp. DK TaxID=2126562 RepID=A0A450S434_9GAMM|nr:MAG: hypothetical protein BECKDK2373C_GA0170839_101527 [Candidatus Kentron sp. DK]
MTWFCQEQNALILEIAVQPRASRNEVAGVRGERLKLRITAPPVDGKANGEIIRFLAGEFRVPRSHLTILSGERGRNKRIRVRAPRVFPAWLSSLSNASRKNSAPPVSEC